MSELLPEGIDREIISPHYDDAVYSCWHLLGPNSRVVTVFGGYPDDEKPSDWDISTGFNNSREAIESRQRENEIALSRTGSLALGLGFKDTVFRAQDELVLEDLFATLRSTLEPKAQIVVPLGFSFSFQHADHIMTREIGKMFVAAGREVAFYADIPYSVKVDKLEYWPQYLPVDVIEEILGFDVEIKPHSLTLIEQEAKKVAVQSYKSQFQRNNSLSGFAFDDQRLYEWECVITPR